jgi:macrodomain Ter protein organizer (MatP/YcbG family)
MRFTITDENKIHAWSYIQSKLKNEPFYFAHIEDYEQEKIITSSFISIKQNDSLATNLDSWCKKHLNEKQLNALRAALRKKKSRKKHASFSVELPRETYLDLKYLAAGEDMNIKDYLVMLIDIRNKEDCLQSVKSQNINQ